MDKQNLRLCVKTEGDAANAEREAFAKRLEALRVRKGLSRPALAKRMGMTLGGISSWEYGRTRPDIFSLKQLANVLEVSCDELLDAQNNFSDMNIAESSLLCDFRALPDKEKSYVSGLIKLMRDDMPKELSVSIVPVAKPKPKLISLPLNPLSMCAGDGFDLFDDSETEYVQLIECEELRGCDELVKVSGRSMEPEFFDGDMALVKHTNSLSEGDIGVFVIDGEGMIKQYRKDGLYPLNKSYKVIRPSASASFRCFGKVVGKVTEDMLLQNN